MFKPSYINPERRDLLKQLLAIGAIGVGNAILPGHARNDDRLARGGMQSAWKDDDRYVALRNSSLWRTNLPERFPDVIVQAATVEEVRAALAFANENDLQIACRASGHNSAGSPLRNGGMMLFFTGFDEIEVDAEAKLAHVQPTARMTALFTAATQHGLDFPTADCTTVALGGFILGGGIGRNGNHLSAGPVCNSLQSAEVLLASGELVTVDADHHPDLFWAMRGCGPAFFGIVTSMTLRLFDAPGAYVSSSYRFPVEALPSLVEFFDARQSRHDPQVSISIGVQADAEQPAGMVAGVSLSSYADQGPGAAAEAESRLRSYSDEGLGEGALSKSEFVPQSTQDFMFTRPPSLATHTDNIYTDDAAALLPVAELFKTRPEGLDPRIVLTHNSQFHAPYGDDISFTADGHHFLSIYVNWEDNALDTLAYEWTDEFSKIAQPFAQGHYLNQIDTGVYPEKIKQSFSDEKWRRLAGVRDRYDPERRFFTWVGQEA